MAWVAAVLAAVYLVLLYSVRPVPGWLLGALGGVSSDVERQGGMRATVAVGARHVTVDVPGIEREDVDAAGELLASGGLVFEEVLEDPSRVLGHAVDDPKDLRVDQWRGGYDGALHTSYYLSAPTREELAAKLARVTLPPGSRIAYERVVPPEDAKDPRPYYRTYLLADMAALDGSSVDDARVELDANTGLPAVRLSFDHDGTERFADLTERMIGHKLAIAAGDDVISAPVINSRIPGGVAEISMGAGPPERAEQQARVLARSLQVATSVPPGGKIVGARWVAPVRQPVREWLARLILGVAGGLGAGVLGWLVAAWIRPQRRQDPPLAGTVPVWPRVAWTLGAIAVIVAAWHVTLPGVNDFALDSWAHVSGGSPYLSSVLALGITPLVIAFILVELAALAVPRWRRLRHAGPRGRRTLGYAVAAVALVLAVVQSYFVVHYLQSLVGNGSEIYWGTRRMDALLVVTMVGGTMVLASLVAIIGSRGIGNGYAIVIATSWLGRAPWREVIGGGAGGALVLGAAACIAVIAWGMLRVRVAGSRGVAVPLPASGLMPVATSSMLVLALFVATAVGILVPYRVFDLVHVLDDRLALACVAVIVLVLAWAFLFARPGAWRDVLARAGLEAADRATWQRAAGASALALVAILVIWKTAQVAAPRPARLLEPWTLLLVVATALDVAAELRDRRRGLVPVWPLHAPLLADMVRDKLAAAGIDHHLQAARLRALLWFFGPFVPIMVLVPPDRAPDAERILRGLFE